MTIAGKILKWLDQFGNWICGGNIDNTISARLGYFSIRTQPNPFWQLLEAIINFSFWPIDGPQHCYDAYVKESKRDETPDFKKGSKKTLALLSIFVVASCIPIAITLWGIKKIRKHLFTASDEATK